MPINGLSNARNLEVDKFNAHVAVVELLSYLKDVASNPQKMKELGDNATSAIRLTQDEIKKRDDALTIIKQGQDLKARLDSIEHTKKMVEQQHSDNIKTVETMKNDALSQIQEREKRVKEMEDKTSRGYALLEAKLQEAELIQKKNEINFSKQNEELARKKDDLMTLQKKIEEVKSALGR